MNVCMYVLYVCMNVCTVCMYECMYVCMYCMYECNNKLIIINLTCIALFLKNSIALNSRKDKSKM